MRIDSHCHVSLDWYEPIETLLYQMDNNGVEKAVLVQMLGQFDNRYQQACVQRYPDRFASVVVVDVHDATACEKLAQLVDEGATGLRLRPTAMRQRPEKESAVDDPFLIWRQAQALGLPISCVGNTESFMAPEFIQLIESFPALKIVLEHLGGSSRPDVDEVALNARKNVHQLARYPNVFIKLTGLGELLPRDELGCANDGENNVKSETLLNAYQLFGAQRMMWGSDFPPVAAREGYANALSWPMNALADYCGKDEVDAIFGETAGRVFFK